MKKILVGLFLTVLLAGGAWFFYPTQIAATHVLHAVLKYEAYAEFKKAIFSFYRSNGGLGLIVRGDETPVGSIALYCKSVPVMTAIRLQDEVSVMVMQGATGRVRSFSRLISEVERLTGESFIEQKDQPSGQESLEKFVLRNRDAVDLGDRCQ